MYGVTLIEKACHQVHEDYGSKTGQTVHLQRKKGVIHTEHSFEIKNWSVRAGE